MIHQDRQTKSTAHSSHLARIDSRRKHINPDLESSKIERDHLHQMRDSRFARSVREPRSRLPVPSRYASRDHELAPNPLTLALTRPRTKAIGMRVAGFEQWQESDERVERSSGVDGEGLVEGVGRNRPEVRAELLEGHGGSLGVELRAAGAGVGDQCVDEGCVLLDGFEGGGQGGLGGYVALYWD